MIWFKTIWAGLPAGVKRFLPFLAVCAVILLLMVALAKTLQHFQEDGHQAGIQEHQSKTQAEIIKQVEQAHAVEQQIEREADAGRGQLLYDVCLQSARTPENCKRFLPAGQTAQH